MARIVDRLAQGLNIVQLAWLSVLAILVTVTVAIDAPTAVAAAALTIVLIVAVEGNGVLPALRALTASSSGPPREERRLRGAFRRQSAPNTPGRPRRPRAPGRELLAA